MAIPKSKLLVVEGKDDEHAILHLLRESGVLSKAYDNKTSPLQILSVSESGASGKKAVIESIVVRAKETGRQQIGFVLDADDREGDPPGCSATWDAVQVQLQRLGCTPHPHAHSDSASGYIGEMDQPPAKIGVWIMPNHHDDGALEHFLMNLTKPDDRLLTFAKSSTKQAKEDYRAEFLPSHQAKAELACWLAWQREPAQPYGIAMQSGKFQVAHQPATDFIAWVRRLFDFP